MLNSLRILATKTDSNANKQVSSPFRSLLLWAKMTLTASDIESLSRSLSRWEWGEYISEAFVIVACAGEFIADLERPWLTSARKQHLQRRSTILLVAAFSASLVCLIRTNELSGSVIGFLGQKAEEAGGKARTAISDSSNAVTLSQDALTIAKGAREEADSFARDIFAAKKQASESALGLEKLKEWRSMKLSDQQTACKALFAFAGTKFDLYVFQEPEALEFASKVRGVLTCAKWEQVPVKEVIGLSGSNPLVGVTTVNGLVFEITVSRTKEWDSIAGSAAAAFRSVGVSATSTRVLTGIDADAIHVMVGKKPQ
jgi:hypothetical protein